MDTVILELLIARYLRLTTQDVMDGIANEVFIGAASLALLLLSTAYIAYQQWRPAAAPQQQPAQAAAAPPHQPAPAPGNNAWQAAADRLRANQPSQAQEDAEDAIFVNIRLAEGAPIHRRVRRHSTIGEFRAEVR